MKKILIQKLNTLRDTLTGSDKRDLQNEILALKFTDDDRLVLTLKKKYYE
jgi:hypothetical protein